MQELKQWFNKYFDKAENILLLVLIMGGAFIFSKFGRVLAPFLASLLLAYVLNTLTHLLVKKFKIKRMIAIGVLYLLFLIIMVIIIGRLIPLISAQLTLFIQQIPSLIAQFHDFLQTLPARYPEFISADVIAKLTDTTSLRIESVQQVGGVLTQSLNSLSSVIEWLIYMFLVPVITFLLLKDKTKLKHLYIKRFPVPQGIMLTVWRQVQTKLGGYARGILLEATIVAIVYIILFLIFKLNYAVLLGLMGGFAVLVPVVGTLIMTIPVVIVGLFQFGTSAIFIFVMLGYIAIHLLDAYILAPFLFGKTLNLHPLAVILALIFFGGLAGFWGLVFAVPLATFIDILLSTYLAYGNHKKVEKRM